MNTSSEAQRAPERSKLSKAVDWAMYIGIAGLFGVLVTRGASGPREGTAAKAFQLPRGLQSSADIGGVDPGLKAIRCCVRQIDRFLKP